jgi:hypothetical protein
VIQELQRRSGRAAFGLAVFSVSALGASAVFAWLLAAAPNSSIGVKRMGASKIDSADFQAPFLAEGHPEIAKITGLKSVETEEDLMALGRWARERMILFPALHPDPPVPADPVGAIDRAASEPVRAVCGHYALLTIAACHAYGIPARAAALPDHTSSEVLFNGRWRVFDTYFNILGGVSALELAKTQDFGGLTKIDEGSEDDIDWDEGLMKRAFRISDVEPPLILSAKSTYRDRYARGAIRRGLDTLFFGPVLKYAPDWVPATHPLAISGALRLGFQIAFLLAIASGFAAMRLFFAARRNLTVTCASKSP